MTDRDTPQVAAFRAELRQWLERNLDDELRALGGGQGLNAGADALERLRRWQRQLDEAGYAAISWPVEHGGRGAGVLEQAAYAEELARAGAPPALNPIGMANIAPAIMSFGTEEQQQRFLPGMRNGEHVWCQGFSEPEAGSDLASLRTTAVLDGDHYVVNGQKVWTSLAHHADWCELLVRTDPSVSKHKGLTALIVDMRSPGLEVRPLRTPTGEAEFNEMFFTDVRVPVANRLGPENSGWSVAMATLNNERAGVLTLALSTKRKVDNLVELARTTPLAGGSALDDPVVRQQLVRAWLHAEALGLVAERSIASAAAGRPPGPEGAIGKLVWSHCDELTTEAAEAVLGPEALLGWWGESRIRTLSLGIAGGTTQVNKNIVATQVLGLPRR